MKKVFLLLSVIGLAFASCTPNGDNKGGNGDGTEVLGAGEFSIVVSDIKSSSAHIKVSAKEATRTFYAAVLSTTEFEEYDSSADLMADFYAQMKDAVEAGVYVWVGEQGALLDTGVAEWTSTKVVPSTEYVVFAFGIDPNGNLTSTDLTYAKFTTLKSTFDPTAWYGNWDITSQKHISEAVDPFENELVINLVDEPLTKTLAFEDATEALGEPGYVLVWGIDGVFDDSLPAVGAIVDNKIELLNDFAVAEEEDPSYGPIAFTWKGISYIESYNDYIGVGGDYAPYTFTMATDGSVSVDAYQGQLQGGGVFATDMYRVVGVILEGEYAGYSLSYSRNDGEPALFLTGLTMTGAKSADNGAIAPAKLSKKNIKVMHKMANQKFVTKTFTAARFAK